MKKITQIRLVLGAFIVLLLLSGITAFPLKTEIDFLVKHLYWFSPSLQSWILFLKEEIYNTPDVMLYGTDWLAFAHIIISLFFIPVLINPVKYQANLMVGMIACLAVFPLAFICGPIRGIPFFHQLIDCGFGVGGIILLGYILIKVKRLEKIEIKNMVTA